MMEIHDEFVFVCECQSQRMYTDVKLELVPDSSREQVHAVDIENVAASLTKGSIFLRFRRCLWSSFDALIADKKS